MLKIFSFLCCFIRRKWTHTPTWQLFLNALFLWKNRWEMNFMFISPCGFIFFLYSVVDIQVKVKIIQQYKKWSVSYKHYMLNIKNWKFSVIENSLVLFFFLFVFSDLENTIFKIVFDGFHLTIKLLLLGFSYHLWNFGKIFCFYPTDR